MFFYLAFIINVIFFIEAFLKSLKLGYSITIHYLLPLCFMVFLYLNPILLNSDLIFNEKFNLLLFVGSIGMVAALRLVPYDFIDVRSSWNKSCAPKYEVRKLWIDFGMLIYILYMLYQMLYKIISVGSLSAVFEVNRLEQGLGREYFGGNLVLMITLFFKIFYYIRVYEFFTNNKYFKFTFFMILPMLHHLMTALTRFDFVIMFLTFLFLIIDEKISFKKILSNFGEYIKIRKRIFASKFIILIIPTIFITIVYMQVANRIRIGKVGRGDVGVMSKEMLGIKNVAAIELNYYNFLNKIYESKKEGKISKEYGLSWFFYPILNFIPRTIWHNKPTTSFSSRYTEKVYYKLGQGNPVVTFTILGEGYMQFGLLGVFFAPILFAFSRYLSVSIYKKIKGTKIIVFFTLISLITYFRGEQPIFYVFLEILYAYFIIVLMSKKSNPS